MTGWMDAVLQWPLSVSVGALVALCALVSWLATRAVRRIWPQPAFKDNHELVGFTYAVYGLIHGVLWLVLVIGAVPTVAYPLLFSSRHAWVQTAITGSILVIVTLGLMVTLALQTPFSGEVSISPDAFRELLESFRSRLLTDPSALSPLGP